MCVSSKCNRFLSSYHTAELQNNSCVLLNIPDINKIFQTEVAVAYLISYTSVLKMLGCCALYFGRSLLNRPDGGD
jgi:hypothetical protein